MDASAMIDYESVKTCETRFPGLLMHLPSSPIGCDDETDLCDVSITDIEQRTAEIRSHWCLQEREHRRQIGQRAVARLAELIIRPIHS
ncbi:MAG: hypothetical protein ACK5PB_08425 [Pirellula sp.]|jgi:hypothetical protein